jgi:hypothetical protein
MFTESRKSFVGHPDAKSFGHSRFHSLTSMGFDPILNERYRLISNFLIAR